MASNTAENTAEAGFAPEESPGRPSASGNLMTRLARVPLKYWQVTLACTLLSAGVAVLAVLAFYEPVWKLEGTLLYQALPIPDVEKSVYKPPKLETHVNLIKSRDNFNLLNEQFGLRLPVLVYDRIIKVNRPSGEADSVSVILEWVDAQQGADMVNFLMDLHKKDTANLRRTRIEEYITSHKASKKSCDEQLETARLALNTFLADTKVQNIKLELEPLIKEIETLKTALAAAQRNFDSSQGQLKTLTDQIEEVRSKVKQEGPDKSSDPEDNKRKQQRLEDEQKLKVASSNYEKKRREYESVRGKPFISKKEEADLLSEVNILYSELLNTQKLIKLREEEVAKSPGSPLLQDLLKKRFEVEVLRGGFEREVSRNEKDLKDKQQKHDQLVDLQRRAEPLTKSVEGLEKQQLALVEQLSLLHQLRNITSDEFGIHMKAKAAAQPVSSNAKKVFIVAFGIPMLLFMGLLVAFDLVTSAWSPAAWSGKVGLPILGRVSVGETGSGKTQAVMQDECRALALRLRQYIPQAGGTILFSCLNDGREADDLIVGLSSYFAMRDERIIIVDARIGADQSEAVSTLVEGLAPLMPSHSSSADATPAGNDVSQGNPGLVQYLVFEGQNSANFIFPTSIPAVEYMPSGGPYPISDVLATPPMKDLLDDLRKKYSLVLVMGPSLFHTVDTEILAAYAKGIILVLNGVVDDLAPVEEFVQSLKEANAPLLGTVICE